MYLPNTTLFDGRDMYRIYYMKNKYMFHQLTMAVYSPHKSSITAY